MTAIVVTTQAELDAALAARAANIRITSPAGLWLRVNHDNNQSAHIEAWGSAHVEAWGSSHVEAWGSAHVEASGSSHVEARESAHVEAWDSSHVEAWGSSHVVAWGSSHVVARESSHVEARESAHVEASLHVAIHRHSPRAAVTGGVVIDLTAFDLSDPAVWCAHHGVSVVDGVATLYKALDADLTAGHPYTPTMYAPGTTVTAADWRDDGDCGGGLHLGPTTHHATAYYATAARWVAVAVPVTELRPILDGEPKCKVPSCVVLHEVDRYGVEVAAS